MAPESHYLHLFSIPLLFFAPLSLSPFSLWHWLVHRACSGPNYLPRKSSSRLLRLFLRGGTLHCSCRKWGREKGGKGIHFLFHSLKYILRDLTSGDICAHKFSFKKKKKAPQNVFTFTPFSNKKVFLETRVKRDLSKRPQTALKITIIRLYFWVKFICSQNKLTCPTPEKNIF